ncbi:MAG TPA: hypothetical protein VFH57_06175 [Gammaproteobacteria bacterium]|nr:hypothetical protein [Gammaproteobacteria bacterium]
MTAYVHARRQFSHALDARRRRRQMSRLELAIAIIIIAVLVAIVIKQADDLMIQAERANVIQVEGRIRAALGLAVALNVAQGRADSAAEFAGTNPMGLLQTTPGNYLGALRDADPDRIEPGSWYFDPGTRRLVYVAQHPGALNGKTRAAFSIQLRYRDANRNSQYDAGGDTLYGVDFVSVRSHE